MNSFEAAPEPPITEDEVARFEAAAAELLQEAGGALSLTEAAKALGLSRQDLYDRIRRGEALGMMDMRGAVLVPSVQLVTEGGRTAFLPGIDRAFRPFLDNHGDGWGTLQWLISYDPNLATTPLKALHEGHFDAVEAAARHYTEDDGP